MNNKGSITIDYLFAFVLVSGFSMILMSFSATFSMVEVVQYMTFAASRNYFASHRNETKQKEAAKKKFAELKADPVVAPLLSGGWFEVPEDKLIVDYDIPKKYQAFKDYPHDNEQLNLFHGVVVEFHAKILDMQIPFFGETKKKDQSGGSGFTTNITSFLGREPTFDECESFQENRWEHIKKLKNNSGAAAYSGARVDYATVILDNGC